MGEAKAYTPLSAAERRRRSNCSPPAQAAADSVPGAVTRATVRRPDQGHLHPAWRRRADPGGGLGGAADIAQEGNTEWPLSNGRCQA